MSKFVCKNEDCKGFGIEKSYSKVSYKFVDGKLQATVAPCPLCGKIREEVDNNIPLSQKKVEIGKYTSASKEQKTAMLKKRSHDHFQKKIKPFKDHQLNEAVRQMKEIKKG